MLKLNINSDESNMNDFLEIWNEFKTRPNQLIINNSYYIHFFKFLKIENINKVSELSSSIDSEYLINDRLLGKINDNIFISYFILQDDDKNQIVTDLIFLYKNLDDYKDIYKILEDIETYKINNDNKDDENGLNILNLDNSKNLILDRIESDNIDFNNFYSKYTKKSMMRLFKKMKKTKSGLSIFYGERGTGKTKTIKSLSNILNKKIFFIPNNMIEHTVLNPEFINFIKKHKDSVFVIDDFELVISNYIVYNSVINNITQMVDSLISEVININIILIFNTINLSEIEELIECNNLLDIVKFDYLDPTEANRLSNKIGSKIEYKTKSRLLDVINNNNNNTNYRKRVGF